MGKSFVEERSRVHEVCIREKSRLALQECVNRRIWLDLAAVLIALAALIVTFWSCRQTERNELGWNRT